MKLPWFFSLFRDINFHVQVDDIFVQKVEQFMSAISDKITNIDIKADAIAVKVDAGFARTQAEIDALKVQVADAPTPEDLQKLDGIDAKLDAIGAKADAASPVPVENPPAA